jgi:Rrf2 family iron-sulfur cluster assembly transcriptional regulator
VRLEITRKTDLALRAMIALHRAEGPCKGSDLAETIGTTGPFIGQVMSPLVRGGWVRSEPGPTGGYRSSVDLSEISLLGLIETVEGPADNGRCVLRGTPCPPVVKCALHDPWSRARTALLAELGRTSLADIERSVRGVDLVDFDSLNRSETAGNSTP